MATTLAVALFPLSILAQTNGQIPVVNAWATTVESPQYAAMNAFDNNPSNRWSSASTNSVQGLAADFAAPYVVTGAVIVFENAYSPAYGIGPSFSAPTYTTTNSDGWVDVITGLNFTSRTAAIAFSARKCYCPGAANVSVSNITFYGYLPGAPATNLPPPVVTVSYTPAISTALPVGRLNNATTNAGMILTLTGSCYRANMKIIDAANQFTNNPSGSTNAASLNYQFTITGLTNKVAAFCFQCRSNITSAWQACTPTNTLAGVIRGEWGTSLKGYSDVRGALLP